ncbi:hypothetical protein B0H16DRAFT_837358 [Mycena metata]|uniref:Uncharacterized protein n=1 Tax=Mycena metata TaxID=1033252 RepID=A0AAD7IY91_9AGAR|nr:hypothetical protein B0H16DRAFT_837358 [Mycena metata]
MPPVSATRVLCRGAALKFFTVTSTAATYTTRRNVPPPTSHRVGARSQVMCPRLPSVSTRPDGGYRLRLFHR